MIMDQNDDGSLTRLLEPHRNSYFYGKLLDVGHLEMEQGYFNRKRWLLNRLALGSGVLCGLQVTLAARKVRVAPGVAVDAYGREIVVPEAVELDPWSVIGEDGQRHTLNTSSPHDVYVCLEYRECRAEFQPAFVPECRSDPEGMP